MPHKGNGAMFIQYSFYELQGRVHQEANSLAALLFSKDKAEKTR
jgi:hypothetical protein